ncbi:MAG: GTP 3',8-cyclase MoaA, partial [Candidatus Methylomirabilales bacterium]
MVLDRLDRPARSLRISVTDRCNLRCQYCMPEEHYTWLPREDILRFEEMERLAEVFTELGVDRVRITGGEPLLRRDLPGLIQRLAGNPRIRDLAMTTNGVRLAGQAAGLRAAGLHRITVSLDTLRPARFKALTRSDELPAVLRGIDAAATHFGGLKLDTVVMRGVNEDELVDLVEFARNRRAEIRFIEYMDVGGATRWSMEAVVTRREMLRRLQEHYGPLAPIREETSAPADRYRLPDGTVFGVISSTTEPFCRRCDRSRLTADGMWYLCLYAIQGTDLRAPLRAGASDEELRTLIASVWQARTDRGAELRLTSDRRGAFIPLGTLKTDA